MLPSQDFLSRLHLITLDLLTRRALDDLLQAIVDQTAAIMQATVVDVVLGDAQTMTVRAVTAGHPSIIGVRLTRDNTRLAWQAFDSREVVHVEDYATWEHRRPVYVSLGVHAVLNVPILAGETCLGIMGMARTVPGHLFTPEEIQQAKILSQLVGAALENARLYQEALDEIERRKRAEADLIDSETRFRLIAQHLNEIILQVDAHGLIEYASPAAVAGLHYAYDDLIGRAVVDLIPRESLNRVLEIYRNALAGDFQEGGTLEIEIVRGDETRIPVEVRGMVIRDAQGRGVGGLAVLRDLTERRELERLRLEGERLQISLQKEQELGTLKTRMMTRIAHEFRTPLANIQTSCDLLARYHDRLTPAQRDERIRTIRQQTGRITSMLDEISAVIAPFAPVPERLAAVPFRADDLIRDVIQQHAAEVRDRSPIQVEIDPPDLLIVGDRKLLIQMVGAVLRNALRFSEASTPIQVQMCVDGPEIVLSIVDHGIGIPLDEQPRVFEPFYRGSNIGEIGGLGVGLTLSRAAAEAHRGTIQIDSLADSGTTVTIRLPQHPFAV
ncbi:MAG: ATP-binding protein [bacterium]|nr:ATP-binding protein [bacterium]